MAMNLISSEDVQVGRKRKVTSAKVSNNNNTKVLTKKSKKEKENLIRKIGSERKENNRD